MAHDAYETFMDAIGFSLAWIIDEAEFMVLIAHAEADYLSSLRLGADYALVLTVEKLGQTSFTIKYDYVAEGGDKVATAKSVHVIVNKKSGKPTRLPEALKERLSQHS
ncbi:MAG: thioesterase family protein [candidate division Zixibacteria bacterium]|nr:thioesterase family protein [candidate division Zixibacteria bacterium]